MWLNEQSKNQEKLMPLIAVVKLLNKNYADPYFCVAGDRYCDLIFESWHGIVLLVWFLYSSFQINYNYWLLIIGY
ncbi:hypothetical protein H1P_30025 [Hyella patelloides LEGE 07179]|uniref:Uncharacterized protein n=1 Tax=Hyella patelloides LEGE 07179 TaxID=945734 RepID=A0A563VU89_9CYAN|nr:hypothetical protein H1P_30025 [Hyella patelloides LEGE 07179]